MRHREGTARPGHWLRVAGVGLLLAAALLLGTGTQAQFWFGKRPMPEFSNPSPAVWINSQPLKKADLQGKVVLIEVWTSI